MDEQPVALYEMARPRYTSNEFLGTHGRFCNVVCLYGHLVRHDVDRWLTLRGILEVGALADYPDRTLCHHCLRMFD